MRIYVFLTLWLLAQMVQSKEVDSLTSIKVEVARTKLNEQPTPFKWKQEFMKKYFKF